MAGKKSWESFDALYFQTRLKLKCAPTRFTRISLTPYGSITQGYKHKRGILKRPVAKPRPMLQWSIAGCPAIVFKDF